MTDRSSHRQQANVYGSFELSLSRIQFTSDLAVWIRHIGLKQTSLKSRFCSGPAEFYVLAVYFTYLLRVVKLLVFSFGVMFSIKLLVCCGTLISLIVSALWNYNIWKFVVCAWLHLVWMVLRWYTTSNYVLLTFRICRELCISSQNIVLYCWS